MSTMPKGMATFNFLHLRNNQLQDFLFSIFLFQDPNNSSAVDSIDLKRQKPVYK